MFKSRAELLEKINLGEDSYLELKEVRFADGKVRGPKQNDIADELAAFANSSGGVLVLGVNDARQVLGVPRENLDAVETLVREACEQSIKPPLAPVIERLTLPDIMGVDVPVLRIETPRSLFVHQSPDGYVHRVGSSKRQIPPDQLARLFQQRSQSRLIRFDETPVPRARLSDLVEDLWRRFAPASSQDAPEVLLNKLGMATMEDGLWVPTVAGVLMATKAPEDLISGAYIQAVAYVGDSINPAAHMAYQLDSQDISGPLDQQILAACDFVRKNMLVAAHKRSSGGREDVPQYDMLAIFEAITNAVAHRDYSMGGTRTRLRMFSNRLEIYSPGMLPNTMTPESLAFRQSARNEVLTSLLARCPIEDETLSKHRQHIMDRRGEGVSIILETSERLSGKRPTYQMLDESELLLTIYAANAITE